MDYPTCGHVVGCRECLARLRRRVDETDTLRAQLATANADRTDLLAERDAFEAALTQTAKDLLATNADLAASRSREEALRGALGEIEAILHDARGTTFDDLGGAEGYEAGAVHAAISRACAALAVPEV